MRRIGLTGGIGSGKSTVAARFSELGAVIIDADQVAREIVAAGEPALGELVRRFGPEVLDGTGQLRRAELAARVFNDAAALADLNAIMHPRMAARTSQLLASAEASGAQVVVHDLALIVENSLAGDYDAVVVVEAPVEVRLERLRGRGIAPDDARARMAAQATDEQRRAVADFVIDNGGDVRATLAQVDAIWPKLLVVSKRA